MNPMSSPSDTDRCRLEAVTDLSHRYGTPDFVKGGGGNTSAKDARTLWIKPSGTTLADLTPDRFTALDRARLGRLYELDPPADAAAREARVRTLMEAAVLAGDRPSVEAPLHDTFDATYVIHTHPPLVNAMTCGRDGEAFCRRRLPEALWVDYIDPGYTLCMAVRKRIEAYTRQNGRQPTILILRNHGIFVADDDPSAIDTHYARVRETLAAACRVAGLPLDLRAMPAPAAPETEAAIRACFGKDATAIADGGCFAVACGPLTPDHLVYARAYPYTGPLTPEGAAHYRTRHGFAPRVVTTGGRVFGIGPTPAAARLALDLARDGALVQQLAGAFGGVAFMHDAARAFIENWEVEAYRQRIAGP